MTIRGLSHKERRVRLADALRDVAAGVPIGTVAANYNYSVASLRVLRAKAKKQSSPRRLVLSKPYKMPLRDIIGRRDAQLTELYLLGVKRARCAVLLRVSIACIYQAACRLDLPFTHAAAEAMEHARGRAAPMVALYREGYTLHQISQQYGITRERVRQLMTKHFGVTALSGGQHTKTERNITQKRIAKGERYLAKYGCTLEQWQTVREIGRLMMANGAGLYKTPLRAFTGQRNNAKGRKIGWELSFWEWWTIWQESGRWEQRGIHTGEYVMCRKGDVGPYAIGNVFIALSAENVSTGNRKKNHDLPIGVSPTKSGKFKATRRVNGKTHGLGTHQTPELAYAAYLMAAPVQARAA